MSQLEIEHGRLDLNAKRERTHRKLHLLPPICICCIAAFITLEIASFVCLEIISENALKITQIAL
jgi:hypothetical protein